MTLRVYYDYKNIPSDAGEGKLNGYSLEDNIYVYHQYGKAWEALPSVLRDDIHFVGDAQHGKYYYPIIFDYRLFHQGNEFVESQRKINIPESVIEDAKNGLAKILLSNTYEGFLLSRFDKLVEHKILTKYDLQWNHFVTLTGNLEPQSPKGIKNIYHNSWEESFNEYTKHDEGIFNDSIERIFLEQTRKHKFICLQRRIRDYRVILYSYLYRLRNLGILTLGGGEMSGRFEINQGWNAAKHHYPELAQYLNPQLKLTLPRIYDIDVRKFNPVNPVCGDKDLDKYKDSYLHIVPETYFLNAEGQMFFSEKILKPFIFLQPFVIFGQTGSLAALKQLGYKTFESEIDESYDLEQDNEVRFKKAMMSIENVITKTDEDLNKMMKRLMPILIHNYYNLYHRCTNIKPRLERDLLIALEH